MKKVRLLHIAILIVFAMLISACQTGGGTAEMESQLAALQEQVDSLSAGKEDTSDASVGNNLGDADVSFTLTTGNADGKLVFIGVGGGIDGEINPTLNVSPGAVVSITLVNGQSVEHDLRIDEFAAATGSLNTEGQSVTISFVAEQNGSFNYYCTIPGHRAAGMEGLVQVGEAAVASEATSIVKNPIDIPAPIGGRGPELVQVELIGKEVIGALADGASYSYFTFNGTVPGPMIRARVGDTIEITLTNETDSSFIHSVDLHAVQGPGGGAVYTQTQPGETTVFNFQALKPGIYVYHCATPSVAHHIANGMYGMILIEPAGGLPTVDKEFYVMQGEIYTEEDFGSSGHLSFSHEKMLDETPEYFVFNGASGALASDENALYAEVGDNIRIYMGVGGPNFSSSFHVIGEIFDKVYPFGSFTSEELLDVQTINVNPGGAWAVEFEVDVPGTYILVDHALSRLERGLVGLLHVEGEENLDLYAEGPVSE
jgi:nitrite reductase (NO-forming)